jgi:superfamily II DNA helicase RecQ
MYNFHKIRTNPNNNEQYFIHESFNKSKTLKEIKSFKRKTKRDGEKNLKCLFFQGEDSKIKYTILDKKKEERNKLYENIDLIETDEKKVEKFENIIKEGNLNYDLQKKMLLFLLNKSKENIDKQKEFKNKIKTLNEQKQNYNSQIQNWSSEIENQSMFLKKIKNLYIFLVTLLMRKATMKEMKAK